MATTKGKKRARSSTSLIHSAPEVGETTKAVIRGRRRGSSVECPPVSEGKENAAPAVTRTYGSNVKKDVPLRREEEEKPGKENVLVAEEEVEVVSPKCTIDEPPCEMTERSDDLAEEEEEEEEEEDLYLNPYSIIKALPPYNVVCPQAPAPVLPSKRSTRMAKKNTLVLDLDETLVHCCVEPIANADYVFLVHNEGEDYQVYARKRPHLDAFLAAVSELFEVVVFTASQKVYGEVLLNHLDPQRRFIRHRLYRDACLPWENTYLKDLNVLGRDLQAVAIVDNSPYVYGYHIENGIPIESWFGHNTGDEELLRLLPFLQDLAVQEDVRPLIRQAFKTHQLVEQA